VLNRAPLETHRHQPSKAVRRAKIRPEIISFGLGAVWHPDTNRGFNGNLDAMRVWTVNPLKASEH